MYTCVLGQIGNTGVFVDAKRYNQAEELPGIKIFSFASGLHFANREVFHEEIVRLTGLDEKQKALKV